MTEWLRDGIEGRSLKATLRLYLLGVMALAPAAAALALILGDQASFVVTPVLVLVLVAVELAFCSRAKLRKYFGELLRTLRLRIEDKRNRIGDYTVTISGVAGNVMMPIGCLEETVDELVHKALYHSDMSIRASAVGVLGSIDDPRVVDLLISALQERDSPVRDSAAVALGGIGDPRAVLPLVTVLADEDESVRSSAAWALRRISTLPTAQATLEPEVIQNIRRMISTDESDGAPSKSKVASKPIEPVRKRA
jgi:hypothetical protein